MNFNQLTYFINVAETLNFTKAAANCFISQTAMTQQIHALEKTVGVPLFTRDKHHVELTAAGRVYLNEARVLLERNNDAIRLARLVTEGIQGDLTIGYISGFGQSDFAEPLRYFHNAYPSIQLHLFHNNMSVLFEKLGKHECDLIISISPLVRNFIGINHRYLKSYPVLAVLPAAHPLANKSSLTYQDLKDENFIMMEPSTRPKDQMEESILIYERGGYYPNIVAMEGNPETLLLMISVGLGISILPEYIVRLYRNNKDLRIIPLIKADGSTEVIDLEIDWLESNQNPALNHMLENMVAI